MDWCKREDWIICQRNVTAALANFKERKRNTKKYTYVQLQCVFPLSLQCWHVVKETWKTTESVVILRSCPPYLCTVTSNRRRRVQYCVWCLHASHTWSKIQQKSHTTWNIDRKTNRLKKVKLKLSHCMPRRHMWEWRYISFTNYLPWQFMEVNWSASGLDRITLSIRVPTLGKGESTRFIQTESTVSL